MTPEESRRLFLTFAGASLTLGACSKQSSKLDREPPPAPVASASKPNAGEKEEKDDDDEVGAVEDLMREHGVIRRILVVYRESATRLRAKPTSVPGAALQDAARLMQTFAENYHEKQLEEVHLLPAVRKAGGVAAALIDPLLAQHQRGRELTEYLLSVTRGPLGASNAEPLARALESFARMYEAHAAQEDTIVFPAWKKSLSKRQLSEMGELFEDIEHKTFGKDGFDDANEKITSIEGTLGLTLPDLTAPPPPPVPAAPTSKK
jgi:hemerythrin-like domain-containing protein